ncbi:MULTISPECIES: hypothetical protein [unclassified Marinovum]
MADMVGDGFAPTAFNLLRIEHIDPRNGQIRGSFRTSLALICVKSRQKSLTAHRKKAIVQVAQEINPSELIQSPQCRIHVSARA